MLRETCSILKWRNKEIESDFLLVLKLNLRRIPNIVSVTKEQVVSPEIEILCRNKIIITYLMFSVIITLSVVEW